MEKSYEIGFFILNEFLYIYISTKETIKPHLSNYLFDSLFVHLI